jgi:hypothetical protein
MGSLGTYLIFFGVGSSVLSFFEYELTLLMWVDTWGDGVAWLIRGAFILVGLALVSNEQKKQRAQQPQQQQPAPVQQGPVS